MNNISKYDDIIQLPHHISKKHPKMSIEERSAQFAPFAALTGYNDEITETQRLTDEKKEIDEELKLILNIRLKQIQKNIDFNPKITFEFFVPDKTKKGGKYTKITGNVKKIDMYNKIIIMNDRKRIPISDIVKITGSIFDEYIK